jgi:NADH-quinone oxidoreductase subunit G
VEIGKVTIHVDNRPFAVASGTNLLAACLSLGFDIPYFCWHPALGSAGACRLCAVKKYGSEKDTKGQIVMSCMEPVVDGLRISIDDPEARRFRASVIEWLMANHPHDCPVCDEGGECHLQDMTVMTGHVYREFRFRKRTHRNQNLGPFVHQEMNRCIQCHRCVRFYRDYAGGRDFADFSTRDRLYYGRHEDGALDSPFSGNLVEVCPTGVFTDKTFKRHYTRMWDLTTAPSVCVHCSLGCNTIPGVRYGTLRRVRNRYNGEVNGYFLCDRGRYGYEFVNDERRIRKVRLAGKNLSDESGAREFLLRRVAEAVSGPHPPVGIGSPRASLEANFALRELVGADRFYAGVSNSEWRLTVLAADILRSGPARPASLKDAGISDAVFVLGEDVTNTAPLLDLALRQAVRRRPVDAAVKTGIPSWHDLAVRNFIQEENGPLFVAVTRRTALSGVAGEFLLTPYEIERLGFAVARRISGDTSPTGLPPEVDAAAGTIARALDGAARPLVVAGVGSGSAGVLKAAADIARSLCRGGRRAGLCLVFPECNSAGLALMGGGGLEDGLERVLSGEAGTAIILENDLYRRAPANSIDSFFNRCRNVIALDHLDNRTTARADTVIPAATFAESEGTLVNNEGRAQRFYKVCPPPPGVRESWRWLRDFARAAGRREAGSWRNLDDIVRALAAENPDLAGIREAAPPADFRVHGLKIPRESQRASGRTAVHAAEDVWENAPPQDFDSPLAFSMEGWAGFPPPPLIPRFWRPAWNSVQSVTQYQDEAGGPLRDGDPGRRLIEPPESVHTGPYEEDPPAEPAQIGEGMDLVPFYHIFGSEELSARSPGIAELTPEPVLLLHPDDALSFGIENGDRVELEVGGETVSLPARITADICLGAAGVPVGQPGTEGLTLPNCGKIKSVRKK